MSDNDDIDPGIAALLEQSEASMEQDYDDGADNAANGDNSPMGFEVTTERYAKDDDDDKSDQSPLPVDLSKTQFKPIEKYFEDTPSAVFDDTTYYKTCLSGEGESAQRLHMLLSKYLKTEDKKDRAVYRQNIVASWWNFLRSLAPKMANPKTPMPKRMAMRFGVVLPSLFTAEQKDFFSRSIFQNVTGEPIMYADEWIKEVASGRLTLSVTDEVGPSKKRGPGADQARLSQLISKNSGKIASADNLVSAKEHERERLENQIRDRLEDIFSHSQFIGLEPHVHPYDETKRKGFAELANLLRTVQKVDRDCAGYIKELLEAKEIRESLDEKAQGMPEESANVGLEDIMQEMTTIRQMAKMTCGRQGNQFPILTREFNHCNDKETGFRENVLRELAWIESIDPGCFCRIHRNVPNRIVPYVLLVPTYGDNGFCWEPFDRYNRITSRGRIVIPMYPRNLKIACLTAVADLRWQVAKEKASFDWMSEGLTGQYYQYIDNKKLKGDLKSFFIEDYILWMTKEANGTQKLEKEVRAIFWRFLPFPQERKDELKKRSMVYQELYQRDINRSMSDGY